MNQPNRINPEYGFKDEPTREICAGCRRRNSQVISVTEEGVRGIEPLAWVCVNPLCWRFTNFDNIFGWLRRT